ncbi:uncharacterized protein KQ657_002302 [Scheffersomyces spartinae]|uniref:L-type lectin-like domain-containing protein n=1 Tax=Scheffersomyces spartinae TaxID=45513 RepID=A0A9P8AKH9_9ASCO|nr:uncharacterized protein KQ657_002302 [Scheffersomyces spartinae]KAG7195916.1 hypothetical protein KQ657_002302 [Scheffersomyces spartinae]
MKLLSCVSAALVCFGLVQGSSYPKKDEELSLPALLKIDKLKTLDSHWYTSGNIRLDNGRLIIDSSNEGYGGIWSKQTLKPTSDEWTIEYVFRSTANEEDLKYGDKNGFLFFMVNADSFDVKNTANFGGPSKFDGFQFLINNKEQPGLKIFNNDGTKEIANQISESIGNCRFSFINTDVPFTIRVSYSKSRKWFKVQIDNNVCFKTDKITIPLNLIKLGLAGSVTSPSKELYDVLKLSVWDSLTPDAIDDHGILVDGRIKAAVKQEVVQAHPPTQGRQSIMEKNRQLREQLTGQQKVDLQPVLQRLDGLQKLINGLPHPGSTPVQDNNNNDNINEQMIKLQESFEDFKITLTGQFKELLQGISQLNEKVIGEVREQQSNIEEIGKKVDLLMNHHKEIQYQNQKQDRMESPRDNPDLIKVIIKWILLPIAISILILSIFIFRLRHDIKHSKLL